MNKTEKLLKNKNFRNNQNYIFGRKTTEKIISENGGYLYPLYKTEFLEFLNSKYKDYKIENKFLLFIYKILNYIGVNNLNISNIKGLFWQINNVFILKPNINIFKNIGESFFDIDLNKETGISNEKIIFHNFFDNEVKNIKTDNYILVIKYNYSLTPKEFLNYIGKLYLIKENNIFTKNTDWFFVFSSIIFILFMILIFFGISGFFNINKIKIISIILETTFLFGLLISIIKKEK